MKKKAAKKAKRTRWVVMCLGFNAQHADRPWVSNDVAEGSGKRSFSTKRAATSAMKKYGLTSLVYQAIKK